VCFWGRRGWVREDGGKELVCISVLRVCFLVSVLIVKGGISLFVSFSHLLFF